VADDIRRLDVDLRWRISALTQSLFICAAAALVAALVSGRWQLILLAAPLLGVLSTIGWQTPPRRLSIQAEPALVRCFEGEPVALIVDLVHHDDTTAEVDARLDVVALPSMQVEVLADSTAVHRRVSVSAERWGRYPLSVSLDVVAPGGLLTATASAAVAASLTATSSNSTTG